MERDNGWLSSWGLFAVGRSVGRLYPLGLLCRSLPLLYTVDAGRVDVVPGREVLVHAGGDALLLAARERGAGLQDAALETVLVDLLWVGEREKQGVR